MQFVRALGLVALLAACQGGGSDAPRQMSTPPEAPPAPSPDAAVPATPAAPGPPAEEGWLDPVPGDDPGARTPRTPRRPPRPARFVQLTLRSTPPGATVYLDGERIGVTPTFWEGDVDSRPRDFTFALGGHVTVKYRFVPITSGVVHPRLEKLSAVTLDAGPEAAPEQ